ncbi:phosphopantetheine-binding protein [Streptomyces melanogenes]|uniref:phosphopantetheine-binding protein n=1 Tax=Streptomyces melanogenes TaxID=67326 RepID=UPI00167C6FE0
MPGDRLHPQTLLGDLDLDSLAVLEFTEALREAGADGLDDADVAGTLTLAQLAELAGQCAA